MILTIVHKLEIAYAETWNTREHSRKQSSIWSFFTKTNGEKWLFLLKLCSNLLDIY